MATTRLLGGRYRLLERLGEGGMSVVWRAYDLTLDRPVAVKLLTARYLAHASSKHRIRAEAQAAAGLSHPHITGVHDYGEARTGSGATVPYVVMELLSGSTLADRLRAGPLPVRTALQICAQVASALAAAHGSGLVHRDVKPANVMLTPTGAKVLDFGLAAAAGAPDESRSDGEVWGTPAYLAPERLTAGEVVPASDVYALGLLLYAALTGERPWRAETLTELLRAHRYAPPAPLPPIDGLPDQVAALYDRCLAKRPEDRPAAHEVARVLAEAVGWRVSAAVAPRSGAVPDRLAAGYARHLADPRGAGRRPVRQSPVRPDPAAQSPVRPDWTVRQSPVRSPTPAALAAGRLDGLETEPTVALRRGWRHRRGASGGRLRAVALAGSAAAVVVSLVAGLWLADKEPFYPGGVGAGAAGLGAPMWTSTPAPTAVPEVAASRTRNPAAGPGQPEAPGGDPGTDPGLDAADPDGQDDPGGAGGAAPPSTSPVANPLPSPSGSPSPSPAPSPSPPPSDEPAGGGSPTPPPATDPPVTEPEAGSGTGSPPASPSGEPVASEG